MKTREIVYLIVIMALTAAMTLTRSANVFHIKTRCDTVIVRDTIRDTVLAFRTVRLERIDTVWLRSARDTVLVEVEVPIEKKTYLTDEYRAVVEGFRPRLAEMEIYRNTVYVNKTETVTLKRPAHWGIGIQAGYGYNFDRCRPYVGIGIQYNIITW